MSDAYEEVLVKFEGCHACGALVFDSTSHDAWHVEQAEKPKRGRRK